MFYTVYFYSLLLYTCYASIYMLCYEIAIHTKNLQKLMTEVYKSLNQESPSFMGEFFVQRELTYDLRIKNTLEIPPTENDIFRHKIAGVPRKHSLEFHA